MSKLVKLYPHIEYNIEGNPFAAPVNDYPGLVALVRDARPNQCTLVPDSDSQKTSDHGFDLTRDFEQLAPLVQKLKELGTRVSLFVDPDPAQIKLAKKIGADRIELYTGPFAYSFENNSVEAQHIFEQHCLAAQVAQQEGLGVNAGHDLNL
ncbi:MAG: pyridoxine 5-phosphate synthase, partial [Lentisphaeria bacterium]